MTKRVRELEVTKITRKIRRKKTAGRMNDQAFSDLKRSLEDALAFERGERRDLKVTRIQGPRAPKATCEIARIH